jgi:hypothetical protein
MTPDHVCATSIPVPASASLDIIGRLAASAGANAVHARGKAAQYDFPTRNHLRRQSSMHWSFSAKTVESLPQCPVSVPMQSRVMIEHAFRI